MATINIDEAKTLPERQRYQYFWQMVSERYPTHSQRFNEWFTAIMSDKGIDCHRNFSLANVALSDNCALPYFGFDQQKYDQGRAFLAQLSENLNLYFQW